MVSDCKWCWTVNVVRLYINGVGNAPDRLAEIRRCVQYVHGNRNQDENMCKLSGSGAKSLVNVKQEVELFLLRSEG